MPRKKNFETQLDKLKDIVESMEQGNIKLDEALKLFEEGIKLYNACNTYLDDAEQKIKMMTSEGEVEFDKE